MNARKDNQPDLRQEVNLKSFFLKIYKNRMLFIISICSFVLMALLYILFATPIYEASTSVLIDSSGRNRVLGESEYVEGGVSLIEIEKNLFNEVGIIKSFSLIEQTVKDLNLNVSYYTNGIFSEKEHYGYFPFEVMLTRDKAQLYDMPFEIQLMAGNRYKLSIEGKDFMVSNPKNGTMREMTSDFNFSKIYKYGELVKHDFFSFTLKKPNYPVAPTEFEDKKLTFVIHETTGITKAYADKLDVNNIDIQASILKINSTGALIDKEVAFLKKLTENYMGNKLKTRNKIASDKEEFIQKQLKVISDSLMKMEADLEFFKRDENAVNLNSTASNAMSQSQYLQSDAAKLKLDIQQYNSILRSVNANKNSDEFVMPSAIGINNPLLNDNILELKRLYTERSKKKFFVTSNNEEMSILNGQIKEATALLVNNLESAIKSSQIALSGAQSQLAGFDEELNSLPMRENQLLTIQRQSTLYENMFNYMNEELAKTGIARAESTSDTQILDEARMVGNGPIAPQKSLLLVLALALGTLLPMTWVVFSPNDLIENIDQIFANTEMPVIASIIYHDSNTKKRRRGSRHTKSVPFSFFWQAKENLRDVFTRSPIFKALGFNKKSKNASTDVSLWSVKESFRDLSTNLKFVNTNPHCVLGVTSIMPEEGKTYTSINLGITLAESGKKILIIDTDMRKPSLVDSVRKVKGKGLANYLQDDDILVDDIIYPHKKLNNLHFIPTAVIKGNVHRVLSGDKIKVLIAQLKEEYDYIILDTPAVGLVSDFLLFWDMIDINLFVVRRNVAKIRFLGDFENLIPNDYKKKSYVVFNDAKERNHKYGYESKYGLNREKQLINESLAM